MTNLEKNLKKIKKKMKKILNHFIFEEIGDLKTLRASHGGRL